MKRNKMNDEERLAFETAIDSVYHECQLIHAGVWWGGEEEDWFEEEGLESPVAGSESEEE